MVPVSARKEVDMSSETIMTAVGLAFVFWGIPLLFIGAALFMRLRTGWTAKVIWRSLHCPVRQTAGQVGFLEKDDFLRNIKTVDAVYCSVLSDPCNVNCGKECLHT